MIKFFDMFNLKRKVVSAVEMVLGLFVVVEGILHSHFSLAVAGCFLVFDASNKMDHIEPNAF